MLGEPAAVDRLFFEAVTDTNEVDLRRHRVRLALGRTSGAPCAVLVDIGPKETRIERSSACPRAVARPRCRPGEMIRRRGTTRRVELAFSAMRPTGAGAGWTLGASKAGFDDDCGRTASEPPARAAPPPAPATPPPSAPPVVEPLRTLLDSQLR